MNHAEARKLYLERKYTRIQKVKQTASQHLEQRHRATERVLGLPLTAAGAAHFSERFLAAMHIPAPTAPEPSHEHGRLTAAGAQRIAESAEFAGDWSDPQRRVVYRL